LIYKNYRCQYAGIQDSDIFRIFCFFDDKKLVALANGFQKKTQKTLAEFKDEHYGEKGTSKREKSKAGYVVFRLGELIHEARLENQYSELIIKSK